MFSCILQNKYTFSLTPGKPWVRIKPTKCYLLQIELLKKKTHQLKFDLMDSERVLRVSTCLHISVTHSEDTLISVLTWPAQEVEHLGKGWVEQGSYWKHILLCGLLDNSAYKCSATGRLEPGEIILAMWAPDFSSFFSSCFQWAWPHYRIHIGHWALDRAPCI